MGVRLFLLITGLLAGAFTHGQYAPPAGVPGTTAMHRDSAAFIGWASSCTIERGFIDMSDTTVSYSGSNKATYGSYLYATGPADGLVVSLGDQGSALLSFDVPIVNRSGPDFAVFENAFDDTFLELAFVEVSSDGRRFVRFPGVSLTPYDSQVPTFGIIEAVRIHNLAGKYRLSFGTPFDLEDIKDSAGIDIGRITHVRVTDVGGCITPPFESYDSRGHVINDPWPTPFDTGGFDLDAIGVIHDTTKFSPGDDNNTAVQTCPNPGSSILTLVSKHPGKVQMTLSDLAGRKLLSKSFTWKTTIDISPYPSGLYIASFSFTDGSGVNKKIVKN